MHCPHKRLIRPFHYTQPQRHNIPHSTISTTTHLNMSQFQLLPLLIVNHIVKYFFNTYVVIYNANRSAALSLMHCCHACRMAFMGIAFDTVALEHGYGDEPSIRFLKCTGWFNPLEYPLGQIVKTMNINFIGWGDVLSGIVDSWMNSTEFCKTRFVYLHSLFFNVWEPPPNAYLRQTCTHVSMWNIAYFFQLLHEMIPFKRDITFRRAAAGWPIADKTFDLLLKTQITNLLQNANSVKIWCSSHFIYLYSSRIFVGSNLTSLSYRYFHDSDTIRFLKVVRLNSERVVSVDIDCLPSYFAKDLIEHDNGKPVIYPSLNVLRLTYLQNADIIWPPPSDKLANSPPEINHFPVLKTLDLSGGLYPFKDNVFAEGINNTLMELTFTSDNFTRFHTLYWSLLSTRFVNLKKIALFSNDHVYHLAPTSAAEEQDHTLIADFLRQLLQSARCLNAFSSRTSADPSLLLNHIKCLHLECMRHLDVLHNRLAFAEILQIIQKAPFLRRLTCILDDNNNVAMINGVEETKLPEYIESINPISSHFFELRFRHYLREYTRNHFKIAVLLAIGCPSFCRISFDDDGADYIRCQIEDLLKTKIYEGYTEPGKRLLDGVKYNEIFESAEDNINFL